MNLTGLLCNVTAQNLAAHIGSLLYGCLNSRCQIKSNWIAYPVVIYNQLSAIIKIDCLFIIVTYDYNRGKFGRLDVGGRIIRQMTSCMGRIIRNDSLPAFQYRKEMLCVNRSQQWHQNSLQKWDLQMRLSSCWTAAKHLTALCNILQKLHTWFVGFAY